MKNCLRELINQKKIIEKIKMTYTIRYNVNKLAFR